VVAVATVTADEAAAVADAARSAVVQAAVTAVVGLEAAG